MYVIEFLFLLQYTLAYWEIIFHCSNSEYYIFEAMLSPLVRKIPSAVVSRLVKFLSKESGTSLLKGNERLRVIFSASNTVAEAAFFGGDEDTRLQLRFTCTD